jgi:hypothetical protein
MANFYFPVANTLLMSKMETQGILR